MTIERKVGMGIAGQPSGGPTNVAEVFSTYLYTGNGSTKTINNGIDLAGEGGLVWLKGRSFAHEHALLDTSRGDNSALSTQTDGAAANETGFGSFLSNGFSLLNGGDYYNINQNNSTYVSWTFRKKKKFFDLQTMASNSGSHGTTTHSHDLGSVPALMIVKAINGGGWFYFHKNMTNGLGGSYMLMNSTAASVTISSAVITATDSQFTFNSTMTDHSLDHIVYLFADNSAEDADDQMIKCGSYSSVSGNQAINLGWEPQWILVKKTDGAEDWAIIDNMRGFSHTADDVSTTQNKALLANTNAAEENSGYAVVRPTSTGFIVRSGLDALYASSGSYIYMAIRAPMMVEPEAATDVFAVGTKNSVANVNPAYRSGFPVDLGIIGYKPGGNSGFSKVGSRLTQKTILKTSSSAAQLSNEAEFTFDFNNGWYAGSGVDANQISWMWKRAKGYMDVVAYSGSGSARTVAHSLGVVPEMIWVKSRSNAKNWVVYHPSSHAAGNTLFLNLNSGGSGVGGFQSTAVSATTFNVDTADYTNESGWTYIAYLFATLAGISKVGSYTGNGSSQTINCGFSAGARFVLIKRINASGNWMLFDSVQGIVSGNDPYLYLDSTSAQVTAEDAVDPHNSGFIINQTNGDQNVSGGTYIFYAIA